MQSGFCIEFVIKTTAFSLLTQVYGFVLCFSLLRGTSAKRLYFLKKGKRIAAVASLLRNDEEWEKRIAAHLTVLAMTRRTENRNVTRNDR